MHQLLYYSRRRAKMPRFPMEIGARTFTTAREYIERLGYASGPVALSCDDTKLHAAWRTYFDTEMDLHFLVGGTGPPLAIANIGELSEILESASDKDKATKVCDSHPGRPHSRQESLLTPQ